MGHPEHARICLQSLTGSLEARCVMWTFNLGSAVGNCDGVSRRHALRLGSCGLIAGLTLPRIMELEAKAALAAAPRAKSCIFLFLEGGPPHQDMWDPKPQAP